MLTRICIASGLVQLFNLGVIVGLVCGSAALAQTGTSTTKPAMPYQDKVMESLPGSDSQEQELKPYDSSGWPRGYSLETVWDQRKTNGLRSSSLGLKANAYIDTPLYGSISAQGSVQNEQANQNTRYSLVVRQIGMPFDGGWRADHSLGMVNLPTLDIARASPRLALPTPAMQGVISQWQQAQGLTLLAAVGSAGRFEGYPLSGYQNTQGQYATLGVQKMQRDAQGLWQWGVVAGQARNVLSGLSISAAGNGALDAQGVYGALRREWPGAEPASQNTFLQINALSGSNTGADFNGIANPRADGLWADAGWAAAAHQHSVGLFYLQPQLAWLDLPLASDLQGGYWRHTWRTRQWSVESGLELLGSVSGATNNGFFVNQSIRYQYSSDTSFGGAVSARRFGVDAQSVLVYSQFKNVLGNTRVQGELASASTGQRQTKAQVDHDWQHFDSLRLSTSLSVDSERSSSSTGYSTRRGLGLGVSADWDLGYNLIFNQGFQARKSSDSTQYSLNAGLSWRFAPQWSLQTNIYATSGNSNATALAQSPLVATAVSSNATAQRDAGVMVSLRYQQDAGRSRAPIGASAGSAAGKLLGSVFLDENKNNQRDASERGAANVTVLLDGRYAVQTDAQGRFEFELVAAGNHVVTVISDNLPLPWQLDKDGRSEFKIYTRESTTVNIAATKP